MNEKATLFLNEMKKQTIGVEVEMNKITRMKAARLAAEFFGTGRFADTKSTNGYCTWSAWDNEWRTYYNRPAISREDNSTLICPDCGTREALESIGIDTKEQEEIIKTIHKFSSR